jgi:two-component system, sensor histidine kinase PdtaS
VSNRFQPANDDIGGDAVRETPVREDPIALRVGPIRWSPRTGTLLFLILGLALAPVGILGVRAGVTQLQRSDAERQALLASSSREQAANLSSRLRSDRIQLVEAVRRLGDVPTGERCRTILTVFPGTRGEIPATQIVSGITGEHSCVDGVPADRSAIGRRINTVRISPTNETLTHTVLDLDDGDRVEIVYPRVVIEDILGSPSRLFTGRRYIDRADQTLELGPADAAGWGGFDLTSRAGVGQTGLSLRATTNRTFFDSADAVLTLAVPVGMWLLALLLSWLVVDTLLLGPVAQLGRRLQGYQPGDALAPRGRGWFRVAEVTSLETMVGRLVDRVASDKQSLAQSLDHQQNLTREVHHRVKNNLQIIASLINLHSRDSGELHAVGAYRTMQRRVDALAVVYRHLQAEGERPVGVAANTLLNDLSNGLRQSLDTSGSGGALHIDTVPAHVAQDIALPMAFFVTELVELAFVRDPAGTVVIALAAESTSGGLARLSVTSDALRGAKLFQGNRASYHRVLQGLARQLRRPLDIDERGGRYAILVPLLDAA